MEAARLAPRSRFWAKGAVVWRQSDLGERPTRKRSAAAKKRRRTDDADDRDSATQRKLPQSIDRKPLDVHRASRRLVGGAVAGLRGGSQRTTTHHRVAYARSALFAARCCLCCWHIHHHPSTTTTAARTQGCRGAATRREQSCRPLGRWDGRIGRATRV